MKNCRDFPRVTMFTLTLSQSKCSLEPKNFLRGLYPPKFPAEGLRVPPGPQLR